MPVSSSHSDNGHGHLLGRTLPLPQRRAQPARAPAPAASVLEARAERAVYLQGREHTESRSVIRGLLLLALFALAISLIRAGADRAFFAGWWRQW